MGEIIEITGDRTTDKALNKLADQHQRLNEIQFYAAVNNNQVKKDNKTMREHDNAGWTEQRTMRQVAEIPLEIYLNMIKIHPDMFKDKKTFRKIMREDEFASVYLTVPRNSI